MKKSIVMMGMSVVLMFNMACQEKEKSASDSANSSLVGSWNSVQIAESAEKQSFVIDLVFGEDTFNTSMTMYADTELTTPVSTLVVQGSYVQSGETISWDSSVYKMQRVYTSAVMTCVDADTVAGLNFIKMYGFDDWELNVPKNIMDRTFPESPQFKTGETVNDIYKIDVTADDTNLYFGLPGEKDADGYPKSLDMVVNFIKQ